jgi:hypothetical protein
VRDHAAMTLGLLTTAGAPTTAIVLVPDYNAIVEIIPA